MNCPTDERHYIQDIFLDFLTECNKNIYLDEDFPIDLHFYMNHDDTAKILLKLYYNYNNIYASEKLKEIQYSLESVATEFDMKLLNVQKDHSLPSQKIGGRGKEKKIMDNIIDGKDCLRYKFIIKPNYISQKHMN